MERKPVVRYAVIEVFTDESGILDSLVYEDNMTLQEAEQLRVQALLEDNFMNPQNIQVIQYDAVD